MGAPLDLLQAIGRIEELETRVAFLLAEARGWQPRLEAAQVENERLRIRLERVGHGAGPDDPAGCPAGNFSDCCGYHDACRPSSRTTSARPR